MNLKIRQTCWAKTIIDCSSSIMNLIIPQKTTSVDLLQK